MHMLFTSSTPSPYYKLFMLARSAFHSPRPVYSMYASMYNVMELRYPNEVGSYSRGQVKQAPPACNHYLLTPPNNIIGV